MKTLYSSAVVLLLLIAGLVFIPALPAGAAIIESKLTADDGAASDRFGYSVAVSGDTAVVGAWMNDENGSNSGAAYVYTRSGTTWSQQAKLTASDAAASDCFGYSVSISGDTVLAGAYGDDDNGNNSGSAYVFTRSGTAWTQQGKLYADDAAANDIFGISVAVSGDTVVVGAHEDDDNGTNSGSAYVFTRSGTAWAQQAKLLPDDGVSPAHFGNSVAIDGDTVVAGVYRDDDNGPDSGSAYVFVRSGTAWTQQAKLTASDGTASDYYGGSVSVSGDTVVVGSSDDDNENGEDSGSAYVYVRSGTTWTEQQKLTASDGAAWEYYGVSVGIDGNALAVGAYLNGSDSVYPGAAYLYTRSGTTWTEQRKLTASDGAEMDVFGVSSGIDGFTVIIGAMYDDDNGENSGSAYVFLQPPSVASISPDSGRRGETLDVTVNGYFLDNVTTIDFGAGITVNSFEVVGSTQVEASITVAGDATLGTRDVSITTPAGSDTLTDSFTVEQAPPSITSVDPASATRGETLIVNIYGSFFDDASSVSFGAGVTVNSHLVSSSTQVVANITVSGTAALGTRGVEVTTPAGSDTLSDAFTVNSVSPDKPVNLLPEDGAKNITLPFTLESSDFEDDDPVDTHTASQWQITTSSGDYSSPVYDSGTDTSNLTSLTIPSDTLINDTVYYWRVRYRDSYGNWSDWSTETSFKTKKRGGGLCGTMLMAAPATPQDLISGGGLIVLLSAAVVFMSWRQRRRKQQA